MPTLSRTVVLRSDELVLEVLSSGAAVRRLAVRDADGGLTDVVLGHHDPATYQAHGGYLGATIGRFANRIDRGRFTLDGTEHQVTVNDRGNALHGGVVGLDARPWTVLEADGTRVSLALTSPEGDQGFPGELSVTVTYAVAGSEVTIDHRAETTAPTVVSLTNHAYFNLDGEASGSILEHTLEVAAGAYTPTRPDLVPTGEVAPVEGTPLDLRRPRVLREVLAQPAEQLEDGDGLDHNLVLDGAGMRFAARLVGSRGRSLEVRTDRPGLQVYTGAHFDGSALGLGGRHYRRNAGIALETQGFPDAPNHPGFPSPVLRPGEVYASSTVLTLGS